MRVPRPAAAGTCAMGAASMCVLAGTAKRERVWVVAYGGHARSAIR
jgi:hypothetical protein